MRRRNVRGRRESREFRAIELGEHFRFALETGKPFGIMRERYRQYFDGYITPELRVMC